MDITNFLIGAILALARVAAFLFNVPFMNAGYIPSVSKVALALAISLPAASKMGEIPVKGIPELALMLVLQVLIGLALSFVVQAVFSAARMAGGLFDVDMGFSMSQMLDPSSNQQSTIFSNLMLLLFALVFIGVGGIDDLVGGVVYSLKFVQPDFFLAKRGFIELIVNATTYMMTAAVQIALPFTASMFIVNFILLVIGKTAPQLNIFNNMFLIKIGVGFALLYVAIPYIGDIFARMDQIMLDKNMEMLNQIFGKGG